MQRTPACLSVLDSKFLARSARTEQSLHFFRVPKARFSSTSNERDSVTGDSLSRPNRKNRMCGRHEKTVTSNAWIAPASATAPRSPILLPRRLTSAIVALALWLLHPSAECPTRKVGLSNKIHAHADRKREQGVVAMEAGTLDPEPVMSWWRKRKPMHGARTSKERSPH